MRKSESLRKIFSVFSSVIIVAAFSSFNFGKTKKALSPDKKELNLLIVTIDTLRADHVGIYGCQDVKTPNIDHLGKNGVLFRKAFCPVPLTLPSHCSLFTGTLPLFHGVRDNGYRLPSAHVTLAEIMRENGYRTAAFVGAFPLDSRFGLEQGFHVYDDRYGSRNVVRDLSFVERKAEEVNRRAMAWLAENRENPFFVWIHYFDPHAPYEPPPPFHQEYEGREYDGEIAYTDKIIGQLHQKLVQWNLLEKTLMVITSDHGEGLGEHKETTHGIFIYDSTLWVPLIFYNPHILPEKRVINHQVSLIDVMPTILDLMELPSGPDIQGRSLKPVICGGEPLPPKYSYIESVAAMLDRNWAPLQGLRTGEWKYIHAPMAELYDLGRDPGEKNNLVEKKPEIVQHLKERLQQIIEDHSSSASSKVLSAEIDRETKEKLMSLGYITGRAVESETEMPDPKTMIEMDNKFNQAIIASETGRLELARQLYREVLQKQPKFIIGYEYAAYNYYKMGKIDQAIRLLEKAVRQNLVQRSLLARLGLYYQEAGNLQKSLEILESLVHKEKDYAEAHNYLGVTYYKTGQLAKAVHSFHEALILDSDYAMAMNNLGNCYLAQKKYDLAREEYKKTISIDPGLSSAHNGLGVVYYRKGLVDEAVSCWEKSLQIDPGQTDTLYNLGRVHLRLGHKRKALRYFELFVQTASPLTYREDIEEVKQVVERLKKELETQ
ncbi:MAG: sulfatase-like hydrolase/transferase [Candidatus Aminicenantes bacterium]